MDQPTLKFIKCNPEARTPTRGSTKSAGFDLHSAIDCVVPPNEHGIIDIGIKIELPEGCYGRIAPRGGLTINNFIHVGAGVIDEDYRGVIKVVLFNHSNEEFKVNKGDRIAQLICAKIYHPEIIEDVLSSTERGESGFGSTGKS